MAPEAFGSVTAIEDSTYDTKMRLTELLMSDLLIPILYLSIDR